MPASTPPVARFHGGPRRSRLERLAKLAILTVTLGATFMAVVWVARHALAIHALRDGVGDIVFHDASGRPWFRLDEHRRDVPIERISPHLLHAVLAVEDHRFARHSGIDPLAIGRAAVRNLRDRELREGASTITQQLARTLFLSNARSPGRKAKEAVLALMLESMLTKPQILELYMNRIYVGSGMYGVETMSRALFRKHASDLTVAEASLVAGLIRAPGALSPWSHPEKARRRSHVVLGRMREEGFISATQEQAARRATLAIRARPASAESHGGYAKEYLRQQFRERFGGDNPPNWKVHTTFQPAVQEAAERAVASGLRRLDIPNLQAALVAIDPQTGAIRAMVGGRDYRTSPFNRAYRSARQPGSAFKPFVYAAALERGYSPVSTPRSVSVRSASSESSELESQELTLRQAFFESDNDAALILLDQIGRRPVRRLAASLGMGSQPDVPSLALGSGTVSPLALTAAYAAFPNGGHGVEPRAILRVVDEDGQVAFASEPSRTRVMSPQVAFQMVTMMRDVVRRGTGRRIGEHGLTFPVGGKTGSTNDFKDAWFVGFSPKLVVGVWVGFDQPAAIGRRAFGARVALPIWSEFMRRAGQAAGGGDFMLPPGLARRELCEVSYQRPVEGCPTYTEYFKDGDRQPGRLCTVHRASFGQHVRRALEGLVSAVGRGVRDIFR